MVQQDYPRRSLEHGPDLAKVSASCQSKIRKIPRRALFTPGNIHFCPLRCADNLTRYGSVTPSSVTLCGNVYIIAVFHLCFLSPFLILTTHTLFFSYFSLTINRPVMSNSASQNPKTPPKPSKKLDADVSAPSTEVPLKEEWSVESGTQFQLTAVKIHG